MKKICFYFFIINSLVFGRVLVIDKFENVDKNSLGGRIVYFTSHKGVKINFSLNTTEAKDESCLQIDYDVGLQNDVSPLPIHVYGDRTNYHLFSDYYSKYQNFAGYLSDVRKANFKEFQYLVLYLKGDKELGYTKNLNIELKDDKRTASYTIEGITDEWQKFVIPLKTFINVDLSKVKYLGLFFHSDFLTRKSGRIYVDNIYLAGHVSVVQQKLKITKRKTEIVLDNDFSEWRNVKWIKLDNIKNLESGKIGSREDLDARFSLQYDDNNLYIAIKVIDNEVINRGIDEDIWREDSVEIFIDPQNDGLLRENKNDFRICIAPKSAKNKPQIWAHFQQKEPEVDEVSISYAVSKRGYNFEIAISWKFLNINPVVGQKFGLSLAVNDFDLKDGSSGKLNYCFIKEPSKEEIFLAKTVLR